MGPLKQVQAPPLEEEKDVAKEGMKPDISATQFVNLTLQQLQAHLKPDSAGMSFAIRREIIEQVQGRPMRPNELRKLRDECEPMFQPEKPYFFYNNYNRRTEGAIWDRRTEYIFGLALSVHGTEQLNVIIEAFPKVFRGFKQGHLRSRSHTFLHYHSVAPLTHRRFDVFRIREFFQDDERALGEGFRILKGQRYHHPKMSMPQQQEWFLQFELTAHEAKCYRKMLRALDYEPYVFSPDHYLTLPQKIQQLWALEERLRAKYEQTLEVEQRNAVEHIEPVGEPEHVNPS